jgi:hypothetical protein
MGLAFDVASSLKQQGAILEEANSKSRVNAAIY